MSNSAEIHPSLTQRLSPVSLAHSFPQSRSYSAISSNSPISWQPPGLYLPIPQLNQAAHAAYNPSTYGYISNAVLGQRDSSGTTFDTPRWANPSRSTVDNSNHISNYQNPVQATRPPLPVRLYPVSAWHVA